MILQEIYNKDEKNIRLDLFLAKYFKEKSRSKIQELITNGYVKVDDCIVKSSFKLKGNEYITIEEFIPPESKLIKENIPLDIIYEDEHLAVLNKSSGIVVHPGAGNYSGTLLNGLLFHFDKISLENTVRPGIVHRLDKDTSGIILVAKTDKTHYNLSEQFSDRKIKKVYRAIVWGEIKEEGEIKTYIKRHKQNRIKFIADKREGRLALTKYKRIQYKKPFSYVELYPLTGRTHQLRVHMNSINHPIILDELYGGGKNKSTGYHPDCKQMITETLKIIDCFALHAYSIEFKHPGTNQNVKFNAPIPENFQKIVNKIQCL